MRWLKYLALGTAWGWLEFASVKLAAVISLMLFASFCYV